jgi:hypothetical protein
VNVADRIRAKLIRQNATVTSAKGDSSFVVVVLSARGDLRAGDHLAVSTPGGSRRYTIASAEKPDRGRPDDVTITLIADLRHDGPGVSLFRQLTPGDAVIFRGPERGSMQIDGSTLVVCDGSGLATAIASDATDICVVGVEQEALDRWPGLRAVDRSDALRRVSTARQRVVCVGERALVAEVRGASASAGMSRHERQQRIYWAPGRTGME